MIGNNIERKNTSEYGHTHQEIEYINNYDKFHFINHNNNNNNKT